MISSTPNTITSSRLDRRVAVIPVARPRAAPRLWKNLRGWRRRWLWPIHLDASADAPGGRGDNK